MAASLEIQDSGGTEIPLDDTNPADFGTVGSGSTSSPVELKVRNTGDEKVFFVKTRAIKHPDSQVGDEDDTFAATVLLIENDYDLKRAALRLGIRAQTVEDHYLDEAMIRAEMGTEFRIPRDRGGSR